MTILYILAVSVIGFFAGSLLAVGINEIWERLNK